MTTRIKVHVLVAKNDAQARASALWRRFGSDAGLSTVVLSCSEPLVKEAKVPAWHYQRKLSLDEYACLCCKAQGPVLALLRDLFLQALHRKVPPFSTVIVHTTEPLDAVSLGRALSLDPFLADRYEYSDAGALPLACVGVIGAAVATVKMLDESQE